MDLERIHQQAATVVGSDRRVITLALARAADSFGNMFLIIVIPLYIAIGPVDVQPLLGVQVPVVGISLTEALLIGVLLSLFGFLVASASPSPGDSPTRLAGGVRTSFSDWHCSPSPTPRSRSLPTTVS